jgi:hypothetical protein
MKEEYVVPEMEDLGSLQELTQGLILFGHNFDGDGGGKGGHSFS